MLVFHVAAGLYALFMLARHARPAAQGRVVSVVVCLAAVAVLAMAARAVLAANPG